MERFSTKTLRRSGSGISGQVRSDRSRKTDIRRLVGNVRDAEEVVIAFIDGDTVGLLEPVTGITRECCGALCRGAIPGEQMLS